MSIIIPANSAVGGGYDVANSCRFDGSSSKLVKAESAGNRQRWTYSVWLKRSAITTTTTTFFASSDGSNLYSYLGIQSDKIRWLDYDGGNNSNLITSAVFRDPSAWYHIVFAFNSNLGSGETDKAERTKLYINGVRVTSFGTAAYAGHNQDSGVNVNSSNFIIGSNQAQSSASTWNGYMAEAHFIDGTAYQADSFGEFDSDSGVWKPIEVSGLTYGTNGFYLDFKDGDNLGNDANGGTDFTESGLAAIDQTTDTCTNNFATMNPLDTHSSATLSEGNTGIATTASGWFGGSGTMGITLGQPAYFEAKAISSARLYFGLSRIGQGVRGTTLNNGAEGDSNFDYMWRTTTANTVYYGGSNQSITIGAISANDICACSVDSDGEVKFYLNDSTVVTFSTKLVADYFYFPILSANAFGGGTESWLANFGNPAYAISSSNTDPNGYGNFEFATKGGYALNTKNLAEYG